MDDNIKRFEDREFECRHITPALLKRARPVVENCEFVRCERTGVRSSLVISESVFKENGKRDIHLCWL